MKLRSLGLAAVLLLSACGVRPEGGASLPADEPGAAPSAPAARPWLMADGLRPGVRRFGAPPREAGPSCPGAHLSYFGGPLLMSPTIVTVFWSSAVNATVQANMAQFFNDVTKSGYWDMLHEYNSVGLSPGTEQSILPGGGAGPGVVIAPLKCNPGGASCKVSDDDVQAELARQIDLNVLPAPELDCTGNSKTIYMVSFPPSVTVSGGSGIGTSCVQFCAYHNTGTYGAKSTPLIYSVLMDQFTGPCAAGCGGNAMPLDNTTSVASHELAEAATDADIGLVTSAGYAFPAAWGDNGGCGEIGDICADNNPDPKITVSGRTWAVQNLWSNAQHKCTTSAAARPVCAGTTLTGCRKCSCGDSGGACTGVTPVCETDHANVLAGACEACTATAGTCAMGACLQSSTPSMDDICPGCVPLAACPAGQTCGPAADGCGGTLDCGTCTAPQTCGGGGVPGACGCLPLAACPAGKNCGAYPDGCGGMLDCGTCKAPKTCGGGTPSVANYCDCTPLEKCPASAVCGSVPDGCGTGGVVPCGGCPTGEVCQGNQCVASTSSSSSSSAASSTGSSTSSSASSAASSSSGAGTGGSGGAGGSGPSSSSGGGAEPQPGGCHCEAAGAPAGTTGSSLPALGMLALAGLMRRRRAPQPRP